MAQLVARALSGLACGDDGRLTTVSQLTRSTLIGVCSRATGQHQLIAARDGESRR
jgi:hypothetical protein